MADAAILKIIIWLHLSNGSIDRYKIYGDAYIQQISK